MTDILDNLEKNLNKQMKSYRKLVSLEKEKQQALVDNKIQEIEAITAQEEKILLEVSRLEGERLHWAEFFGKEIGKKVEDITLADLEDNFPTLKNVRQELEEEITKLKDLHEINTKLLENAVNLVNFTIQTLTNERQATYTNPTEKTGKKDINNKANLIDKSI